MAASAPNPAILDAPLPEQRHEQRPKHRSEPHQGHKPHHEKKPHGKPQRQGGAPEKEPVDKSQLPAFLFRKVRLPQD